MIIGGIDDESLKAMDYLVDHEGITSFKLFMAYPGVFYSDDGQILRAMQTASDNGAMIMMHAENGIAIDVLVAAGARPGRDRSRSTTASPARRSSRARPPTGRSCWPRWPRAPLYIVHMSASEALDAVAEARDKGCNVFAETCPQYLYLTLEEHLAQAGLRGRQVGVLAAAARTGHAHHQDDLWKGLRTNDLSVVSTDHCPFCFKEQKELGLGDFSKIPNGIGGVEHRMDLIYQGVVDGQHRAAPAGSRRAATTPARMFGLYPRRA